MSEYFLYQSAGRREVDGGTAETYVPVSRYQIAREVHLEFLEHWWGAFKYEDRADTDSFQEWLDQREEK